MMFTITKKNMSTTATTMPQPCSVPEELKKLLAQCAEERYWTAASTSIGATDAAWM